MDWAAIPVEVLNGAATSLTYVDAKGMRFHLPAYLIADLHGELHQDICYHLDSPALDSRFSLLSSDQKAAVRHYLELQLEVLPEPNFQFEQSAIRESINGFGLPTERQIIANNLEKEALGDARGSANGVCACLEKEEKSGLFPSRCC